MSRNRVRTNVLEVKKTGVGGEILDQQGVYYPLSFFGWDVTSGEKVTQYIPLALAHIKNIGFGQVYIPPNEDNNFPTIIQYMNGKFTYEIWSTRFPLNNETRPYTEDRFRQGDIIHNVNPSVEGVMGWVCYKDSVDSNTGEWRAWGELKRFSSEVQRVEALPVPQSERESQVVLYNGLVYICIQHQDGTWHWDTLVTSEDVDALDEKVHQAEKTLVEFEKMVADLEFGLDWKASVDTYTDLVVAYPEPDDGWTVNVKDTDITYRYSGTEWIPISANSIPLASATLDGRMSKEDKQKLDSLLQGFCYLGINGTVVASPGVQYLMIASDGRGAVKPVYDGSTQGRATIQFIPNNVAYCRLSDVDGLTKYINDLTINELVIIDDDATVDSVLLSFDVTLRKYLKITISSRVVRTGVAVRLMETTGMGRVLIDLVGEGRISKVEAENSGFDFGHVTNVDLTVPSAVSLNVGNAERAVLRGCFNIDGVAFSEVHLYTTGAIATNAVRCRLEFLLGSGSTDYEFQGMGNIILGVSGTGTASVVCPADTIISTAIEREGKVKYSLVNGGDMLRLPMFTVGNIKPFYKVEAGAMLRAVLNKGTGTETPKDVFGNSWTVMYNDSVQALTQDEINALQDTILVKADLSGRVLYVPRPILKTWSGSVENLPSVRDKDTVYFAY